MPSKYARPILDYQMDYYTVLDTNLYMSDLKTWIGCGMFSFGGGGAATVNLA